MGRRSCCFYINAVTQLVDLSLLTSPQVSRCSQNAALERSRVTVSELLERSTTLCSLTQREHLRMKWRGKKTLLPPFQIFQVSPDHLA